MTGQLSAVQRRGAAGSRGRTDTNEDMEEGWMAGSPPLTGVRAGETGQIRREFQ